MNERVLYENWKSFASKSGLDFEFEDIRHIQGVISNIKITSGKETLVLARIGKTGTEYRQEWTKVFFNNDELPVQNLTVKNSFLNWFSRSSDLEKQIRNTLKAINASELKISDTESVIKFNHILFDEDELKAAFESKGTIKQLLTVAIRNPLDNRNCA